MAITASQFVGEFEIKTTDATTLALNACIFEWEIKILTSLFGSELYAAYVTHLTSPAARFTALLASWHLQEDGGGKFHHSEGLTRMLLSMIYAKFVLSNPVSVMPNGVVMYESEAASGISWDRKFGIGMKYWNRGYDSFRAMRWRMKSSEFANTATVQASDFPEYAGKKTIDGEGRMSII